MVFPLCGIWALVKLMTQALRSARSFAFVPVSGRSIRDLLIRLSSCFASEVVTPSGKGALSQDALLQQRFVLEFSCDRCYMVGCQCLDSLWYDTTPLGVGIGSDAGGDGTDRMELLAAKGPYKKMN